MAISVERTKEAILIKLPLDTDFIDIQQLLNYSEYVSLVRKSKATDEEIETQRRGHRRSGLLCFG